MTININTSFLVVESMNVKMIKDEEEAGNGEFVFLANHFHIKDL